MTFLKHISRENVGLSCTAKQNHPVGWSHIKGRRCRSTSSAPAKNRIASNRARSPFVEAAYCTYRGGSNNSDASGHCVISTNVLENDRFRDALHDITASPACKTASSSDCLQAFEFEKKTCRAGFRKIFGHHLPSPGVLEMNFGLLDINPTHESSRWRKKNKSAPKQMASINAIATNPELRKPNPLTAHLCLKNTYADLRDSVSGGFASPARKTMCKSLLHSGVQLMSSDWILEGLVQQIQNKRSVRAVMYELIRDAEAVFNSLRSACPVLGVRIMASGRLGKTKKGMAKHLSLSIGKVPLGSFNQKVDYSQGFALTKYGAVGLKVWVAFR